MTAAQTRQVSIHAGIDSSELVQRVRAELSQFKATGDHGVVTPVSTLALEYGVFRTAITYHLRRHLTEADNWLLQEARQHANWTRFNSISDQERRERSRKGYGNGLALLSHRDFQEAGRKSRRQQGAYILIDGMNFQSQSEWACGRALMAYVPGFKLLEGTSFQVPIDGYSIDYLVERHDDAFFIEWHPIKLLPAEKGGDFISNADYGEFMEELHSVPKGDQREAIKEKSRKKLALEVYAPPRLAVIEKSSYVGTPLILLWRPEQLYESVLPRVGADLPPSMKSFLHHWNKWLSVARRRVDR